MYNRLRGTTFQRLFAFAALAAATSLGAGPAATRPATRVLPLDPIIRESSGLAASARHAGVLWTHGDSGNPPRLFAVDAATGRVLRAVDVAAANVDWEDVALAPGPGESDLLYVADTGNNGAGRATVEVIVLEEPDPRAVDDAPLRPLRVLKLRYPAAVGAFDCEALYVRGGRGYLIEKNLFAQPARRFSFELTPDRPFQTLRPAGTLPVRLPVTGADLSRDGKTLALSTVAGPRVLDLDENGDAAGEARSATYLDAGLESAAVTAEGVAATTESGRLLSFPWALFSQ